MKKIFTAVFILSLSLSKCFALTSDTIHVKRYSISVDTINFLSQTIKGRTTVVVESKLNNVNNITLSLLQYTVDSVISGNQNLIYAYNDTMLHITPPTTLNQNDSVVITIAYHGHPQPDPKFGGFSFSGTTYAYNIGVGFDANPHPFGRTWFPCIDEFVDKALFDFHIVTDSGYVARCNGNLDSVINNVNKTLTWNWSIEKPITSYLACMAVAPFYIIQRTYQGIPVQIACLPGDTAKTLSTFQHLDSTLMYFIYFYGTYPWNKVGYSCVPFAYGAMEHATSIHIGKIFLDGTLNYETIWAHELSHMWWGDKVTTSSEQDMWLNEGMAVSNEHLFTELFYGEQAYKNTIRSNLQQVLQFAHIVDSGYWALNAVPHDFTYGRTVYWKGSDIVHTLRKFMGDTAYFAGCKGYLNNLAFGNAASADLRDQLSNATGIDLTDFFNDWVFTPGFPQFSVDSFSVSPGGGNYDVTIYTRQKQKGNTHIYNEPVECTLSDGVHDTTVTMLINAKANVFNYTLSFAPVRTTIDKEAKMAEAIIADEQSIDTTGAFTFAETNASINVIATGGDTSVVRIEHNFVAPDDFKHNPGIHVSDYHYYRVDGIFHPGFLATATFNYNGSTSTTYGYLDNTLITGVDDSLVLLYRSSTADDWQIANGYTLNFNGLHTSKIGSFTVDTLETGEYCFGYRDYNLVGVNEQVKPKESVLSVYPNPIIDNGCTLHFDLPFGKNGKIEIFNESGQVVFSAPVFSHQQFVWWDTFYTKPGIYTASIFIESKKAASVNILVVH